MFLHVIHEIRERESKLQTDSERDKSDD